MSLIKARLGIKEEGLRNSKIIKKKVFNAADFMVSEFMLLSQIL